ncbi:MAG: AMP-binding protein [Jatrophihabitantaceae bacterium]
MADLSAPAGLSGPGGLSAPGGPSGPSVSSVPPVSLVDRLERLVRERPQGNAVEDERVSLTFEEFWNVAHGLALELASSPPGSVMLSMDRSAEGVVAYWAAFLAGRRITPVSPSWPASRSAALARSVGATCTLVASAVSGGRAGPSASVGAAGDAQTDVSLVLERFRRHAPPPEVRFDIASEHADAYVLFTSGSTGRPKGVRISRSALTAYVQAAAQNAGLGPGDRVSHNVDYTFDPSIWDVFVTLSSGATVCVPHQNERLRPVTFVNRARLSHWCSVPSLIGLAERLRSLAPAAMPTLRHSIFLGEALLRSDAELWRRAAPNSVLVNSYGPTEVTNACFEYQVGIDAEIPETDNGTVPIGAPYPGLDWGILDAPGSDASEGELVVRGVQRLTSYLDVEDNANRFAHWVPLASPARTPGVQAGAWRAGDSVARSEESAAVPAELAYRTGDLVRITPAGLVHLGRVDRQVKVRGRRVEPAEVEHLLRGILGVSRVAVFAERRGMQTRLAAVVEVDTASEAMRGATREADDGGEFWRADPWQAAPKPAELRELLPTHLTPARWVALSRFPINARGKLDLEKIRGMAGVESS